MKYENVEEWLNSESPEEYDFVEDTQTGNLQDFDSLKEDVYEQFFIYKMLVSERSGPDWGILEYVKDEELKEEFYENKEKFLKKVNQYADIKDPDTDSDLLQKIYKQLYPNLGEHTFMKKDKKFALDTMTSAMTRFTDAMKKLINEGNVPQNADKKVIGKICCIYEACKCKHPNQEWWSMNFSIIVIAFLDRDDREKLYKMIDGAYPAMKEFLKCIHRIGNYCPVPVGFNSARSGFFASHDYWDLTLMKIREWYFSINKEQGDRLIQEELLHNKIGANALYCIRWLECFEKGEKGWHNFVDTFFMQDYVDKDTYEVNPFWKNGKKEHGWELKDAKGKKVIGLPDDTAEINMCLKEICERINARSEEIIEALRN